jgi:hypothetical protein
MLSSLSPAIRFFAAVSAFVCLNFDVADDTESPVSLIKSTQNQDVAQPPKPADNVSVETVLKRWQQARSKIHRIDARFSYTHYDTVPSKVQRHGEGQLAFDSSGRGFFKLFPLPLSDEQITQMWNPRAKDKSGYALGRALKTSRCSWTGTHFYTSHESLCTLEPYTIPEEERLGEFYPTRPSPPNMPETSRVRQPGRSPPPPAMPEFEPEGHRNLGLVDGFRLLAFLLLEPEIARPFILGMPVEVFQPRYNISLVPNSGPGVRLKFQSKEGAIPYPNVELILARDSWMPKALKVIETGGMAHSVYVFNSVQFNNPNGEPLGIFNRPNRKRPRPGFLLTEQTYR